MHAPNTLTMTSRNDNDPKDVLFLASDIETAIPVVQHENAFDPNSRENDGVTSSSRAPPSDDFPLESLAMYQFLLNGLIFGLFVYCTVINVWEAIFCLLELLKRFLNISSTKVSDETAPCY